MADLVKVHVTFRWLGVSKLQERATRQSVYSVLVTAGAVVMRVDVAFMDFALSVRDWQKVEDRVKSCLGSRGELEVSR